MEQASLGSLFFSLLWLGPKKTWYLSSFSVYFHLIFPLIPLHVGWLCGNTAVDFVVEFHYQCFVYPRHVALVVAHYWGSLYLLEVHMHHLFMMLLQCMSLRPWEDKFLIHFCSWQFFTVTYLTIFFVIFPIPMTCHRCFREEKISGGKIKFRVHHIMEFGSPNSSRILE